jgi:hypothetical protein
MRLVNDTETDPERHYQRMKLVAQLCPSWLQTCMFRLDGTYPDAEEVSAYLAMLRKSKEDQIPLQGILLYGLARPSMQAEEGRLSPLPANWLDDLAHRIEALGFSVRLAP